MKKKFFITVLIVAALQCYFLQAQTLLDGFSATNIGSGWNLPVGTAFTKTGDQLFVWEKAGKVYVNNWNSTSKTYDKQTTPVIDISPEVGNWRDMGLVGFAIDPHFEDNGYIYLMYCVDRHHLMHFGKPTYSEVADDYLSATIGRITRYTTVVNGIGQRVADLSTRKILLGESPSTGIPIIYESHGVGSLAFAMDGTLLASAGDASSYIDADIGSDPVTYYKQALEDSIITPQENVGAFRSQMLNSHNGKILRIDPSTGDGVRSNPFYDPMSPRSAKSRTWALGFRNPFRFSIRPNSGSADPTIGDVGEIFVGDVGYNTFEEITVIKSPGANCGWPLYEGLIYDEDYGNQTLENKDEPNPLYGVGGCTQRYFTFRQLLRQANPQNNNIVYNPCNPSIPITGSNNNRFLHRAPLLDWQHGYDIARVGVFNGEVLEAAVIGTPQSNVAGSPFRGNATSGGLWYTGNMFPSSFRNTLFISDYGANWIKNVKVDYFEKAKRVDNFAFDFNGIVHMAENPMDGSIYCIEIGAQRIKRIAYVSNKPPVAMITADKSFGGSPLVVSFKGTNSYDPEELPLQYRWDFGDGSPPIYEANPLHVFSSGNDAPRKYVVQLQVTDKEGDVAFDSMVVSVNNTPPAVSIASPLRNWFYTVGSDTTLPLRAEVSDQEHLPAQLMYQWQTILRHNNHEHPGPVDTNKMTSSVISRIGCNGEPFHWIIKLAVTDGHGLTSYDSVKLFPACATTPPVIIQQPLSAHICDGQTVAFQTATNDYYIMPIQWQRSTDRGVTWETVSGATSSTLRMSVARSDSGLYYRAVWYNNKGLTYSDPAVLHVHAIPPSPSGADIQKFCYEASVSNLSVEGQAVKWYREATGGMPLGSTELLQDGHIYYATQTVQGCESKDRFPSRSWVNDALHPKIILNGSNTSGIPQRYEWRLLSGPNIPIIDSPGAAITTVRNLIAGTYRFRLMVDGGASVSDVTALVNIPDTILKADAGFDRTIQLPENRVRLDGSASTGSIFSYQWRPTTAGTSTLLGTGDSLVTEVTGLVPGIHSFELAVTGRTGGTKKDTVQIQVLPESTEGVSPIILAHDTAASQSESVELSLSGLPTGSLLILSLAHSNPPSTIFQPTQAKQPDPQTVYNDGTPIELGMKFRSAEDGYITGIRFFKAMGNTGTHIGELFTADGIRLAQATFVNETSSGWQQVDFDRAVRIQKNTTYVAAYYSSQGFYSGDADFFNNSVVELPLTALASGIDGVNGLYSYTDKPAFPVNSYFKTNYWVDVVFTTAEPVITSEPALNWVKRSVSSGSVQSGNASIYSAFFTRGGQVNVSAGWGKGPLSGTLYALSHFDIQLAGNTKDTAGQSIVSVPIAAKRTNSLLIGVSADRNAMEGQNRQYSENISEANYHLVPGGYTGYHYHKPASSIGMHVMGLRMPTGMSAGSAVFEVMGTLRLPVIANAGFNQRLQLSIPPEGEAVQSFCDTNTIDDLKATGNNIQWFLSDTGGDALKGGLPLQDSTAYYASQFVNGCNSVQRLKVVALVKPSPSPPPIQISDNCDSTLTFSVIPYGQLQWSTGDTTSSIIVRTSDTFYVYRTVNGCIGTPSSASAQPVLLALEATVAQPVCVGDSGFVVLYARGGAGDYVFNNTPSGKLPVGTYVYSVTDSSQCTRELKVVLEVERSYWTGVADSDWHNPLNWSKGKVPTAKTHVIIPMTQRQCIISMADAEAASIQTILAGAIRIDNGRKVMVSGKCLVLPSVR